MEIEAELRTPSFSASFNAPFSSQAALEVSSDLKNLSFGSQSNLMLGNEWQFWLDEDEGRPLSLGVISTIKLFRWFYNRLAPEGLPSKAAVLLFKNGIEPTWGHPKNRRGGHFKMTCKTTGHLFRLWHDVAMVLIGEQFSFAKQISGAGCSLKKGTVTFWLSDADDEEAIQQTRAQLVNLLPAGATISFRDHTSLLGKESAMIVGAGIIDADVPSLSQATDGSKLVGIAAELVPHTARHQKSRSCPEELAEFDPDTALTPPIKRPRAFSEAAKNHQTKPDPPRNRGRSCSKVLAKKRTESPVNVGMRKVLSADALDEYIPHEPIQSSIPTLKHVRSWADECDSQVSSRCISPTGGDLSEGVERQPLSFMPCRQSPRASPQRNAAFYDMNAPMSDYMSGNETWDQSGPPSLAQSGPTSPSGPAAQSGTGLFHGGSPTHTPYSTSPFSGSPPSGSPVHSPYASPQSAPFSLGGSVIPAHEPAKAPAQVQQGVMTGHSPVIIQHNQTHTVHPHHNTVASPEQLKVQLDQLMQRQLLQQVPVQQAHPQSAVLQQQGLRGPGMMPWAVPLAVPMQQQLAAQHLHPQMQLQQQQIQHQQRYVQYQVPQLAPAMSGSLPNLHNGNLNAKGRKPVQQPQQQQPQQQQQQQQQVSAWDTKKLLDYLTEASGLDVIQGEDAEEKTISKSRSPRNRRKIRERKIKEAAEAAKREMMLWGRVFGTPENTWVTPEDNMYLPMPPSFNETDWFRFVQACKKEQVGMTQLSQLQQEMFEKLGVEDQEQVKDVLQATPMMGPQPHPLIALTEKILLQEKAGQVPLSQANNFLTAPQMQM
eukprot:TRINITY_DN2251_c1_g5_i1.p1 TRINITY_DN2251_c1_g5~~TRINITY_DN2251_c1_g5_i1.p1  ORF type:complete len:823 (+),score=195.90 TRINITY_DN2251_c1_g5_i1:52-2520(+)